MNAANLVDYLKYYRVIRHYFCAKYKITYPDLELLFFLYSEQYFSTKDFEQYNELFYWEIDHDGKLIEVQPDEYDKLKKLAREFKLKENKHETI